MGWLMCLCSLLVFLLHSPVNCSSSFSSNSSSTHLCPHDQSFSLLHFKNIFSFDSSASSNLCDKSYPKMLNWEEGTDCCSWDGVTCDRVTGHMIGLDLSCSWLQGTIHSNSSLFLLPRLQWLNLDGNYFNYSQISSKFGQFASLTHLNLSFSAFSGHIPFEISQLSRLVSLDLSRNYECKLETLSLKRLVQNLTELRQLFLNEVDMSSVEPGSLMNLSSSLTSLGLNSCRLRGKFPGNIFHLPNLHMLKLDNNYDLTGYFPKVNWSSPIKILDLSITNFSGEVPDSIDNLKSLNYLALSSTNFLGEVPDSISNLKFLNYLDLSSTNFLGLPDSIGNLESLNYLDLSWTNFLRKVPDSISNLKSLHYLDLSATNLSRELLNSIGNLKSLHYLHLQNCQLSGSFPTSLGNLEQIIELDLDYNHLIGEIPSSLSNLGQLSFLRLLGNNFNRFPFSFINMTRIVSVDLSYNQLVSPILSQVFPNLTYLDLSYNSLNGTIPSWVFTLPSLLFLDLSHNQLSGHIHEFQYNSILRTVYLDNNELHGSIPRSIFQLVNLTTLHLSSNNLSGIVELDKFSKLKYLNTLDLSNNSLSSITNNVTSTLPGVLQLSWENLRYLNLHSNLLQGPLLVPPLSTRVFSISNNKLTGKIPSLICNVSSLQVLDLSNNSLSGIIPQCLGNFSDNLSVLDLRMNRFQGTIPGTFAKGNKLRNLDFNGNQLEGPIPQSLINCINLEVLDLGNNKIHDTFPNWLDTLPELQVLVLRSNGFHGPIGDSKTRFSFPKLRIIDLSQNEFTGLLPTKYFKILKAMMNVDEEKIELSYMGEEYYQDSVMVTMKGLVIELVKILTIFTTIDFSNNKFQGEIPKFIGNLNSLRVLNLSHNSLTGQIPPSLGNLTLLESLDLSSNKLNGVIPSQLTSLTFLAVLNLSHNQFVGLIPRGKQFDTFENNSYNENLRLCGFPLSKKCSDNEAPQPPPLIQKEGNFDFAGGFGWKVVLIGYGCGMIIGLVMGYLIFLTGKPEWFVKIVEGERHKNVKRSNRSAQIRGGRRN